MFSLKLSGLPKAIQHTVRVRFSLQFLVKVYMCVVLWEAGGVVAWFLAVREMVVFFGS